MAMQRDWKWGTQNQNSRRRESNSLVCFQKRESDKKGKRTGFSVKGLVSK